VLLAAFGWVLISRSSLAGAFRKEDVLSCIICIKSVCSCLEGKQWEEFSKSVLNQVDLMAPCVYLHIQPLLGVHAF
jgi:hypothetical protein